MHAHAITRGAVTCNMPPDEAGNHTLCAQVFHHHAYTNMLMGSL